MGHGEAQSTPSVAASPVPLASSPRICRVVYYDGEMSDADASPTNVHAREQALIGRTISGRYRIEAPIAAGGMGAVFRGEHLHMRKRVAIKILHAETEGLEGLAAQFEREAIAGAHVSHPNVAIATDFGELDDGSYFLVLEYLRGVTLAEVLEKGPLAAERAVPIARQIAAGLGAAHEMGIVHRDVKSSNIMLLEEDEQAKLIDFGFAKVPMDRMSIARSDDPLNRNDTDPDKVFGTIHYLAPEAARGMDALDGRSDLYALGIIMYEMLTGTRPFDAEKNAEIFRQHREVPPPPFVERAPMIPVPAALEAIVMRLLAKDPAERYASAEEVIAALDRVALAKPRTFQRPDVELGDIHIPPPRRTRLGGVVFLVLMLGVLAAVVWFVPAARERARALGLPLPAAEAAGETEPAARPQEVDGLGASAWTAQLLSAPKANDWAGGAKALGALAELDPSALKTIEVAKAATALVTGAAATPAATKAADDLVELLAERFGPEGVDVLYSVVEVQPAAHPAAKRAQEALKTPRARERASPPLRITLELRDAPCEGQRALFERAGAEGDARTLKVLAPLRQKPCRRGPSDPCCFQQDKALQQAVTTLTTRTAKKSGP